ncbi:MAG TPA: multiheme c-type cytochrome [Candidatus Sulfotelmatobacter sp.]|jgi:hypothetical protein|nr:multiheme c-type cytochrome [Candidatus Sulfotelmatobacter sp.]
MPDHWKKIVFTFIVLACAAFFPSLPQTVLAQLSTDDHLAEPGFWATKSVKSHSEFASAATCGECHRTIYANQAKTSMNRTLLFADASESLDTKSFDKGRVLQFAHGIYRYEFHKDGQKVIYTATDGKEKKSAELLWAFGTPRVAQSYLFKDADGRFHEARVSYFVSLQNLHITPAREFDTAKSLLEAMERAVPAEEVKRCFACHATEAIIDGKFDEQNLVKGVSCEACHGPGARHVATMQAAKLAGISDAKGEFIFNPARLGPTDSVEFCGACHGAWWDVKLSGVRGVGVVRAQPYRLVESKCWGKGDERLRCFACHDPHVEVSTDPASYDGACSSCHLSGVGQKADAQHHGAACPVATKNCTTCHMPKTMVPTMHDTFTDHKIRIVKAGEAFVE